MTRPLAPEDFIPVGPPSAPPAQSVAFHAGGRLLACLVPSASTDVLDLQVYDRDARASHVALDGAQEAAASGPPSLAEELARERGRQRFRGITQLRWLPGGEVLLSALGARLLFADARTRRRGHYEHPAFIEACVAHPSGRSVAFVAGSDLWLLPLDAAGFPSGAARRLTDDGSDSVLNGIPDAMTREEIYNGAACCWAADGQQLVSARYDAGPVETITVGNGAQTQVEPVRYARPGRAVATFALRALDPAGGQARELLAADPEWPYLLGLWPRAVGVTQVVVLGRLRRDQTAIQLLQIDLASGHAGVLLEQTQQPWINALDAPRFRRQGGGFFLLHERAGVGRIGLHDDRGAWQRDIGVGCGHVEHVLGCDVAGDGVIFCATGADPRERHLFHAAPATDWIGLPLTREPGTHGAELAPDAGHWVRTHEATDVPAGVRLESLDGKLEHAWPARPPRGYETGLAPPRLATVRAADGVTPLHAAIYEPAGAAPPAGWPVVLIVYGGPHLQAVRNAWALTADLRAQFLAQHGFLVLKVDNRGASGRGIEFERAIHLRMGNVEVDDQCAALEQLLAALPQADHRRVAACGWSYGGYMTLRCLQRRPDLFSAGVAGAPVTDWLHYDAPYTERYMGTPVPAPHFEGCNEAGYRQASVLGQAAGLRGRLLLIHGMNDENVLLRHTMALAEELAARRIPYELLLLPNERHSVRSAHQRPYLELRILDFLTRALAAPPAA
jgi:dipeptidyl-peptidase-4